MLIEDRGEITGKHKRREQGNDDVFSREKLSNGSDGMTLSQ